MFEEGENTGLHPRAGIKENKLQGTRTGIEFFQQKIGWVPGKSIGLFCRLSKKIVLAPDTEEPDEDLNEIIQEINRKENATNLINSICM